MVTDQFLRPISSGGQGLTARASCLCNQTGAIRGQEQGQGNQFGPRRSQVVRGTEGPSHRGAGAGSRVGAGAGAQAGAQAGAGAGAGAQAGAQAGAGTGAGAL